ncbi:MAG: D-alanyl-D-alanine carboxypeptidase [Clostridiales bacterium]|jgi:D-alanyl-D-alanine carboxypeptidase (penicillin-binding protein 5/6)|nr:D-alanyl-D-alanine carboxypeptidase [Clostridiales bacterium]
MKRRFGLFAAILVIAVEMMMPSVCAGQELCPNSKAAVLIDVASGRILYQKNMKQQLPMASTTKIMTAITAIEEGNLQDTVTASLRAQNTGGSSIYLQAGERLTLEELLYGLMLQSGNDAAVAIAEHIAGSCEEFAHLMNKKATGIGAVNSNFINPHGLDAAGHYTTAEDLAKITAHALKNPEFKKIVATKQKKIPWWGRDYSRVLKNKNRILWQVEGGDGVKTGFTKKAGRCLVASATRDDWQLASVVLNCGPMWEESKALLEYGFKNYKPVMFYERGQFVKTIAVKKGKEERVRLVADRAVMVPLSAEERERVLLVEDSEDYLQAPVMEGQVAGSVKVLLDGEIIMYANLVCQKEVKERSIRRIIPEILKAIIN